MTHLSPLASPSLGWKDFSADLLNRFKIMLQRTIVVKPVLSRLLNTETRPFARTKRPEVYSVSWTPNPDYVNRRNILTLLTDLFIPPISLKDAVETLWADCSTLKAGNWS